MSGSTRKSRAVVAESQTCREHKSLRDAIVVDAVEIAELGDHLCVWLRVWVDDYDLVFLIGANPDVAFTVDHNPVRGVDTGDEDRRRSGGAVGIHRNLDDLMESGVGHVQRLVVVAELDAVRAERRRKTRSGRE